MKKVLSILFFLLCFGCATQQAVVIEQPKEVSTDTFAPYEYTSDDSADLLADGDKKLIHDALLSYLRATQKSDGHTAAQFLSSDSHQHFEAIASKVQTAPQKEMMTFGSSDRMLILMIRDGIPLEVIRHTKPSDFFARIVAAGIMKREAMDAIQLSTITGNSQEARVAVTAGGTPVPVFFSMLKEPNGWRVNYRQIRDLGDKLLEQVAKQRDMRLIDVEMQSLQNALGHPIDPKHWNPPQ